MTSFFVVCHMPHLPLSLRYRGRSVVAHDDTWNGASWRDVAHASKTRRSGGASSRANYSMLRAITGSSSSVFSQVRGRKSSKMILARRRPQKMILAHLF